MKPLLSYYGGKQRLSTRVVNLIETMPHTVYSEPFCGGAAVLFAKPRKAVGNQDRYREAINDKNDLISNFYRVGKLRSTELTELIKSTLYSQSDHFKAIAICKDPNSYSDLERAWAVYVNCNMSFANKMNGGWGAGVVSRNLACTWQSRLTRLIEQLDRLQSVHIGSEDAIKFIKRWDSPTTLHYCDPPYVDTDQGHYKGYAQTDLNLLIETLSHCHGSFILSGYSAGDVPPSWSCIEIPVTSSASGKGKVRRDRSIGARPADLGDRSRVEKLWYLDRSPKSDNATLPLFDRFESLCHPS